MLENNRMQPILSYRMQPTVVGWSIDWSSLGSVCNMRSMFENSGIRTPLDWLILWFLLVKSQQEKYVWKQWNLDRPLIDWLIDWLILGFSNAESPWSSVSVCNMRSMFENSGIWSVHWSGSLSIPDSGWHGGSEGIIMNWIIFGQKLFGKHV